MTKTMPRDSSASGALVPSDSAAMAAAAATAAAGKLPFPLLTRTNYAAWAMRMKYLLRANGAGGPLIARRRPRRSTRARRRWP